jgi:hypothetical protein
MRHLFLLLLFSFAGFAAEGPACLNGPVTKGTLTVTCTKVDVSDSVVASDLPQYGAPRLFIVRVVSTDPGTVGARITLSLQPTPVDPSPRQSGVVMLTPTSVAQPLPMSYVFSTSNGFGPDVVGVNVEELKPSAGQSF